jgi:hypothetical protein
MDDLPALGERHDLVIVSSGSRGFSELFPPLRERSPFGEPQRLLSAGYYTGVNESADPAYVTLSLGSPNGEIISIPALTFEGIVTVLLFECVPGGDYEVLARTPYEDDPKGYERMVLETVRAFSPAVFERIDPAAFALTDPNSFLRGAVTPTVRTSYARLDGGTYAIALGDGHVVMDPVCGLGANAASHSAFALGETILEGGPFDEAFCQRADERRLPGVLAHFDFTNFMLHPGPNLIDVIGAMSQNPTIANDFTDGFTEPMRQWANMSSPQATAAYLASFAS